MNRPESGLLSIAVGTLVVVGAFYLVPWDFVAGAVVGFVSAWFITLFFYRHQTRDLDEQVERLARKTERQVGNLRQEVLSVSGDVRNVGDWIFELTRLCADAGLIHPRRGEHGRVLLPVTKTIDLRWRIRTLEQEHRERVAQLEEELREARRPLWQRIWRFIMP